MSLINLDPYVITKERIGRGAFSIIYKGYNKNNKEIVAIKEINYDNHKIIKTLTNEFEILKSLKHENIILLHETYYDKENKNIYLVLDYYELGDLSKFLNKKSLKEPFAKKYMKQLSNGLEYLYENNIMHRDLKPQNILVSKEYILKITDFGFARYMNNDIIIKTLCGSPMYMAPEIIKYKKYNNTSDLWSIGVIMYEMLFGSPPFKSTNFIELIKDINKYRFSIPINKVISIECRNLLYDLLQKNPSNRIQWNDFFNNKWFNIMEDNSQDNSNKLLDFSINEKSKLPEYNKLINNESNSFQFNSFRHKSIKDIDKDIKSDIDIFDNKNMVVSITSSNDYSTTDDEFYDSNEYIETESYINTYMKVENTKSINIQSNSTVHITPDMLTSDEYKYASDPTLNKSVTNSVKEYIYSSLDFFKQSYKYIKSL
jgi:serine/threonine protein kinase